MSPTTSQLAWLRLVLYCNSYLMPLTALHERVGLAVPAPTMVLEMTGRGGATPPGVNARTMLPPASAWLVNDPAEKEPLTMLENVVRPGFTAEPLRVRMVQEWLVCEKGFAASGAVAEPMKLMASWEVPPRTTLPPVTAS